MRLLHILGDSKFGGGSVVVGQLALRAMHDGWSVDVLTSDAVFQQWLRERGVGVVDLDVIWREIRPLKDTMGLIRLTRFLQSDTYNLIHTHTSKAGFVARLAATLAGTTAVVHTVHGFAFHEASSRTALLAYSNAERLAAMFCHRIVTVSEHHRNWALRLGIGQADKILAIPNGIPDEPPPDPDAVSRLRQSLGCDSRDVILLSTGRLAPQKGLRYLIEAMPEIVSRSGSRVVLWLAGDGPLRAELENQAHSLGVDRHMAFLGFRTDIRVLLAASDLVVLPSLWEGLSISLLEAMAMERPVVTTSIGSNLEVTDGGKTARLVPPADPQALAVAVTDLIRNPRTRATLAMHSRQVFTSRYTEKKMLDAYSRLYFELSGMRTFCNALA